MKMLPLHHKFLLLAEKGVDPPRKEVNRVDLIASDMKKEHLEQVILG